MSKKLLEDEKVAALVAKERLAAQKALHQHVKQVAKEVLNDPEKVPEDKGHAKVHKAAVKAVLDGTKAFFQAGGDE